MSSTSEHRADIGRLWQEHMRAPFPARLHTVEAAGVEMALLDATIAGCVSVWHDNGGSLDSERRQTLRKRIAELDQVLPLITEAEELRYLERLHQLALLASDTSPQLE
ncbi:hypothetical protein ACQPW1_26385 [Nocardia sp. CA-128927]|uniref:hypothetical protein n=1 Tax=Nocardia sp. CA-128927 TaxID=3239975 RepID=UPI003D982DF0